MSFSHASVRSSANRTGGLQTGGWVLLSALLVATSVGCGPAVEEGWEVEGEALGSQVQEEGGIIGNGLITGGLITSGLTSNGLVTNGLTSTTMASADFNTWFNANLDRAPAFMEYTVRCAVPPSESRTYTNATTGTTYNWPGGLGLAPAWAGGAAATLTEQQVVTACLGAHANKFGVNVMLAMMGTDANGTALTLTSSDMTTYAEKEGCFFGNIFTSSNGVLYAGNDRSTLKASESTPRACGLSSRLGATDCSPIVHVGSCQNICQKDATGTYYTSCTYNGVTYKPFTTRIKPADIYQCGDGVCQFTEKCGTGTSYDNCASDCGAC